LKFFGHTQTSTTKGLLNKNKTQNQQKKLSPKTTKTLKIAKQFSLKITKTTKTNRFHPDTPPTNSIHIANYLHVVNLTSLNNFGNKSYGKTLECLHFLLIILSSWRHSTISFM